MSIDYKDMYFSYMLLMAGCGRSFTAVDWCIVMMCHNVMHLCIVWVWTISVFGLGCLGVNERSIRSSVDDFSA